MKAYPPETRERARELSRAGLGYKRIAARLGIPASTIFRWLHPDYAERQLKGDRARKTRYRGVCVDCGGSTDGSNGRAHAPRRCDSCNRAWRGTDEARGLYQLWPRERVIAAIQAYADEFGEPPAICDWSPTHCAYLGDLARLRRARQRISDGEWPWFTIVVNRFGSWNAGIAAAGLKPRAPIATTAAASRSRSMRAKEMQSA